MAGLSQQIVERGHLPGPVGEKIVERVDDPVPVGFNPAALSLIRRHLHRKVEERFDPGHLVLLDL